MSPVFGQRSSNVLGPRAARRWVAGGRAPRHWLLALVAGCADPAGGRAKDTGPHGAAWVTVGPAVVCNQPGVGLAALREVGAERGLHAHAEVPVVEERSCPSVPGGVVMHDLDADGDVDLALRAPGGVPHLFENDGTGHFVLHSAASTLPPERRVEAVAAVDLDGDDLPDLILPGWGHVHVAWNLGGLRFTDPEPLWMEEDYPRTCIQSVAVGDLDGDGDLDLVLPGGDEIESEGAVMYGSLLLVRGMPDQVLRNDNGVFTPWQSLIAGDPPQIALMAMFTDRDMDGDLDLMVTTDRAMGGLPPAQFHRNEGGGVLVEDGAATGTDVRASAMGMVSWDVNEDGWLDYCMSDVSPSLTCMVSDGAGQWFESGAAMGLQMSFEGHPDLEGVSEEALGALRTAWATWGLELVDLDNDGWEELVTVGGAVPHLGDPGLFEPVLPQPDALFQGAPGGLWREIGRDVGFGDPGFHYGVASADLDGDGHREVLVGTHEGPPQLWEVPCGDGHWVELELKGPDTNRQGLGALVTVEAGGRTRVREVHALRYLGQSDSALHFGLGEVERIDRLTVRWADGRVRTATDLPVDRTLTLAW